MKAILREIGKKAIFTLYYYLMMVRLPIIYNKSHEKGQLKYLSEEDFAKWKTAFLKLLKVHYKSNYGFSQRDLLMQFPIATIDVIRKRDYNTTHNPIVVLCVKNDKMRLRMLIEHYRNLGIERFAIVDNGSTDGSYEWMQEQDDIDIFRTYDKYSSLAKEAWINRIISHYGFDRWYIQTDSDELIEYIGDEENSISKLVEYAENERLSCLKAITFDMYGDEGVYTYANDSKMIKEKLCWMDTDSYEIEKKKVGNITLDWFTGGPRKRLMDVSTSLIKFPLVYFNAGTISANAHFIFPYEQMNEAPCVLAILHYKFLESDKIEFQNRAKANSGFAFGGAYYRKYIEGTKQNKSFLYQQSKKFENSYSLDGMPYIGKIRFCEETNQ